MIINAKFLDGTETTFATLQDLLNNIDNLSELGIYQVELDDEEAESLAKAIETNKTITKLNFGYHSVEGENGEKLCFSDPIITLSQKGFIYIHNAKLKNYTLQFYNQEKLERNLGLMNILADGLIARTQNQSMLHALIETYNYVMRDFLINNKNQTPDQADMIIADAIKNYKPINAIIGKLAKNIEINVFPEDITNELLNLVLPKGQRAMQEARKNADGLVLNF